MTTTLPHPITNYRPISLLSSVSKLFEKLVFDKLFDFLIKSSISSSQFGFIRNHSTVKQLLLHTKNIICALERNKQLDTIILDIRKAFDTFPMTYFCWTFGMWVSLVLCRGYYKPISRIGVNVFQWKVITLVGCLFIQACLKAVSLGPFFLLSTLMTYHHLFLSPQLYCMPMTPSFLRQCHHLLIAPFFSSTFRHLTNGAPNLVCLLMQARVFSCVFVTVLH